MDTLFLNEQRCGCGKLLLKGIFFDGVLEIKCKKCGTINKIGNIKLANDDKHYLFIVNDKGIIVNVSLSACKILGYSHEELIGKHFSKINPNIPKEINEKLLGPGSVLSEDTYFHIETTHQSKDGKMIPVNVFLKLYKPSCREKCMIVSAGLKDSKSNNENSENNESKYIKNSCDFYFDINDRGVIEFISSSMEKYLGLSVGSVIGKNFFHDLHENNKKDCLEVFLNFSSKREPFRSKCAGLINNKGEVLHDEIYFSPNYNDSGKFIGYRVLVWVEKKSEKLSNHNLTALLLVPMVIKAIILSLGI